jgi:hypothetical protein
MPTTRTREHTGARARARGGRAQPAQHPAVPPAPPPLAMLLVGAWTLALVLAPPLSVPLWAVNGFRAVAPGVRAGLALGAAALGWLAWRARGRMAWSTIALAFALLLAVPLRERAHVLGDTDARLHAIVDFASHAVRVPLLEWSRRLHASSLDLVIGLLLPAGLVRMGLSPAAAGAGVARRPVAHRRGVRAARRPAGHRPRAGARRHARGVRRLRRVRAAAARRRGVVVVGAGAAVHASGARDRRVAGVARGGTGASQRARAARATARARRPRLAR